MPLLSNILGVDYGEKNCGIAWSPDSGVCLPLEICETKQLLNKILELCSKKNTKKIVFGLPLSSTGKENKICKSIREFCKILEGKGFEIFWVNEQFSTSISGIIPRKKSEKNPLKGIRKDDLAAAKILEFFLTQEN